MKYLAINAVPMCFIALAAWMIYLDKPYWGWVVVAALCCAVYPKKLTD